MATTNSRTDWVDIDGLAPAAAETAVNAAIETLETAGFIVTQVTLQSARRGGTQEKMYAVVLGLLPAYAGDAAGIGL